MVRTVHPDRSGLKRIAVVSFFVVTPAFPSNLPAIAHMPATRLLPLEQSGGSHSALSWPPEEKVRAHLSIRIWCPIILREADHVAGRYLMFNFEVTYLSQFSIVVELFGQYERFRYELSLDMTHMWWYGYLRYPQQPKKQAFGGFRTPWPWTQNFHEHHSQP